MDGAKHTTDTSEVFCIENSGRQAYILCRSTFERKDGTICNENLGGSKIKLS